MTVVAKCIGGIGKERKEQNIPLLIRVVVLLCVSGIPVMCTSISLFVLHCRSPCAEGASAAPSPSLCRVQQLNFHLAPLEETRLHNSQNCQLHCALQPLGPEKRLSCDLLHQVKRVPLPCVVHVRNEHGAGGSSMEFPELSKLMGVSCAGSICHGHR